MVKEEDLELGGSGWDEISNMSKPDVERIADAWSPWLGMLPSPSPTACSDIASSIYL